MLPIKRRIKKGLFPKIIKEGVSGHGSNFYLKILDRKDVLPSLFAFVVPLKVKKTSVGRHLIKRRMTAIVEKVLSDIKVGLSIIIFVKKDVSLLPYFEIEKELLELLIKSQVLNEK